MTTAVELEGSLETNLALDVLGLDERGELLLSGIEAVDIGSVVLVVVESHDLLRDRWLKGLGMWEWTVRNSGQQHAVRGDSVST